MSGLTADFVGFDLEEYDSRFFEYWKFSGGGWNFQACKRLIDNEVITSQFKAFLLRQAMI